VAPPRKQADNRENKHFPIALGGSCLLEKGKKMEDGRIGSWEDEKVKEGIEDGKSGG